MYLRAMPSVGYWATPGDPVALQAPVIVTSMDDTAALDASLGDRYVSEFYGLRPEVLLSLYVERRLWDRFLAGTVGTPSGAGCQGAGQTAAARCGHAPVVALWRATSAP